MEELVTSTQTTLHQRITELEELLCSRGCISFPKPHSSAASYVSALLDQIAAQTRKIHMLEQSVQEAWEEGKVTGAKEENAPLQDWPGADYSWEASETFKRCKRY